MPVPVHKPRSIYSHFGGFLSVFFMRFTFLFAVFAALVGASNLVRINDKNFQLVVKDSGKFTLVDFYADWCRHCTKLMPTIEELADLYADTPEVQIVKINGDDDGRKMTTKYDVPGFPTLLLFHGDDKPIEFEGLRDLEAISNFIQQVSGIRLGQKEEPEPIQEPSTVMSINDDNFQKLVLDADYKTIIVFSAPWCRYCKQLKPIWLEMANHIYDSDSDVIRFGEVDLGDDNKERAQKIKTQFGIKTLPTIMLFDPAKVDKDGLKRPVVYDDDRNLNFLVLFINDNTGLSRNFEGKLFANAGRILALDEALRLPKVDGEEVLQMIDQLAKDFEEHGRDVLVNKKAIFFKDDLTMLPYYRKVVAKLMNDEREFFVREALRLDRIVSLEEKNVERSAYDYLQKRLNILKAVIKMRGLK